MNVTILFASSPLDPKQVDDSYADEYRSAQQAGFNIGLIDLEALSLPNNPQAAIQRVTNRPGIELEPALYRGWMLRPNDYERLYTALLTRNLRLINSLEQYRHAHHFPESYVKIEGHTPKSMWLPLSSPVNVEEAQVLTVEAARLFANNPIILKDYVKSRKHEWDKACYIPDASDAHKVRETVRRFLELQGSELNEGLVLRAFEELEAYAIHPLSGMPLSREMRVFVLDHEPLWISTYWEAGEDHAFNEVLTEFQDLIHTIKSRFFTIDFAKKKNGSWIVLELGDGQVAGLPDDTNTEHFYAKLKKVFSTGNIEEWEQR